MINETLSLSIGAALNSTLNSTMNSSISSISSAINSTLNSTINSSITSTINSTLNSTINSSITSTLNSSLNSTIHVVLDGLFHYATQVDPKSLAVIGAAIAVGAAGIASAIGAGIVGATGARSVSENPKNFSTALLFQALPQTQGIYGFLIAILIMLGAGIIGTGKELVLAQGIGAIGAGLAVGIAAVSAIGQGIAASAGLGATSENKKTFGKGILFSALPETQALYGFIIAILILIGVGLFGAEKTDIPVVAGWAAVGAGLAVGIAGISAVGQGIAAASGIGNVLEKPKIFGKAILFAVLPETQALYGFIVAILILIGFGLLGETNTTFPLSVGMFAVAAGLSVGIAGVSAIGQGITASSGVTATSENPKMFGKSILFSVLPETQALYGFLIAVLLLVGAGVLGVSHTGITSAMGVVAIGAGLSVGIAGISAIGQGMAASSGINAVAQKKDMFGKSIIFSIIPETQALMGFLIAILLMIGSGIMGTAKAGIGIPEGLIAIGAGLAVGMAAVSAIGQGIVVSSAINATTEDRKLFGKSLLFSVLPQTQALYGFLIAILLLVGGGIIGASKTGITPGLGLAAVGAGLAVGLAAISAVGQGIAAAAGVTSIIDNPKMFGKSILFSALPETQALYGFLVAILILVGGGLLGAVREGFELSLGLIALGSGLAVGIAAVSAVGQGIAAASGIRSVTEKAKMFGKSILFSALPETQALYGFLIAILLMVGGGILGGVKVGVSTSLGVVAIGASLAVGIAGISAVGQGMSAATGITAVSEKKDMFGKSIIFSIIPETQALMGFLIAILILIGTGLIGASKLVTTTAHGLVAIGAGLAVGIAAVSAFGQGFVVSSSITAVTENKKMFGKSLLFSVLPQTQALYGFLIATLLLVGGGILGTAKPDLPVPLGLIAMGAGLAVGIAGISAVGQGMAASSGVFSVLEKPEMFGKSIIFSIIPETQALMGFLIAILLLIGSGLVGSSTITPTLPLGLVAIGAGIAVGIAAISAVGQGIAVSSATGAVTENPKMFGKSLLFSVLPQTQALYGVIISILLMTGVGLLGSAKTGITLMQGFAGIGAGISIGYTAISAVGQGIVAAASIGGSLRDNKSTGKGLVLSVIPETYAIFGLLISILIMLGLKII